MKPKRFRNFVSRSLPTTAFLAMSAAIVSTAYSATVTWDGETDNELGLAANWLGDVLPSAAGDTALWDGTQSGALSLAYAAGTLGGSPGNTGLNLEVAATQTDSIAIDGTLTAGLRVNGVLIADGSGPFALGNSDATGGNFNITLGGVASSTQV